MIPENILPEDRLLLLQEQHLLGLFHNSLQEFQALAKVGRLAEADAARELAHVRLDAALDLIGSNIAKFVKEGKL